MKDKDLKPDLGSDVGSSVSVSGVLMVAVAVAVAVVVVVLKSMAWWWWWCWCGCGDWESIIRVLLSPKFSAKTGCLFVLVMERWKSHKGKNFQS